MRTPIRIDIAINVPTGTSLDEAQRIEIAAKFRSAVEPVAAAIEAGSLRESIGPFEVGSIVPVDVEPTCRICQRKKTDIEKDLGYPVQDQSADVALAIRPAFAGETGGRDHFIDCGCLQRKQHAELLARNKELRRRNNQVPQANASTEADTSRLESEIRVLAAKLKAMESKTDGTPTKH